MTNSTQRDHSSSEASRSPCTSKKQFPRRSKAKVDIVRAMVPRSARARDKDRGARSRPARHASSFRYPRAMSLVSRLVALAILTLEGANLLLLDEPTNHLDIPAQEVLQDVLEGFEGTVLLVSHDRYLVDRLATQIWEVRAGALTIFRGNYKEFVAARDARLAAPASTSNGAAIARVKVDATKAPPAPSAAPRQRPDKEARRRAQAVEALETRIHEHEGRLKGLHEAIQQAGDDFARARTLSLEYASVQEALDALLAEWERLAG